MKKGTILAITLISAYIILFAANTITATALTDDEIQKVIVNSADWRDVYTTIQYANLAGKSSNFLVSTRHSTLLLNQLDKGQKNILVISSKKNPYVFGYKPLLESRGFVADEIDVTSANLELARKLDGITNYIVLDDAYGYNAISAAPYAMAKKSFVLFADKNSISAVNTFLRNRKSAGKLDELIAYGTLDREVKTALADLNPTIINKGDRFENNIEIVKKYELLRGQQQTILSNGEFIESSIMSGGEPVLFIGASNVPDVIADYIKNSNPKISVGILIGNELIGTATSIRRQIGIPVFVKFAQSARAAQGSISPVEDLDRFPMPKYYLDISINSIRYNSATKQLEITYKNNVDLGTYIKTTITLSYDGTTQKVGDVEPVFIDKGGFLTVTYDVESMDGNISADVFAIYGEGKRSLEHVLRQTLSVQTVKVFDAADLTITSLLYDKSKKHFIIGVMNKGSVDAYASGEIFNIILNDEERTISSENTFIIPKGASGEIYVPSELTEDDIAKNPVIHVRVRYGEREDALVKSTQGDFNLEFAKTDIVYYTLLFVIIILLILLFRKRKKKNEHHHG